LVGCGCRRRVCKSGIRVQWTSWQRPCRLMVVFVLSVEALEQVQDDAPNGDDGVYKTKVQAFQESHPEWEGTWQPFKPGRQHEQSRTDGTILTDHPMPPMPALDPVPRQRASQRCGGRRAVPESTPTPPHRQNQNSPAASGPGHRCRLTGMTAAKTASPPISDGALPRNPNPDPQSGLILPRPGASLRPNRATLSRPHPRHDAGGCLLLDPAACLTNNNFSPASSRNERCCHCPPACLSAMHTHHRPPGWERQEEECGMSG